MHSACFECPQLLFRRSQALMLVQLVILCPNTPIIDSCFCLLTTGSYKIPSVTEVLILLKGFRILRYKDLFI